MDQLKQLFASLTRKQKITMAIVAALVIGGLVSLQHWNHERDFKPIYTGLAQEDAAAVVAKVRESGTEFRLGDGGATVLVPGSKVAELRLQLASAGVPRSGHIGFELFDKTNFGTSDFAEQINYHRALEGELERSVMSLAEVEQARVHVTFAKDSIFLESRQPGKASVLVKLRPGARLSPQNVAAICQLTASAVEGLQADAVSVVDMRGNLLSHPHRPLSPDDTEPSAGATEYRQQVEKDLLAKINTTLEPLLGADKFRAGVSVECDFTSGEQSEETFDPANSVMVTSQKTEDLAGTNAPSGVPGVTRRTENVAYQSNRTVRHVKLPQGNIKRISVSVLVDHAVRWEGSGAKAKRIVEPPSPQKLKAIKDLVAGVIGLSPQRGDQLTVETLPFEATLSAEQGEPAPAGTPPAADPVPAWLRSLFANRVSTGGAIAGLVALLGAVVVMMRIFMRPGGKRAEIQTQLERSNAPKATLASTERAAQHMEAQIAEQAAMKKQQEIGAMTALKAPQVKTKKSEVLARHIAEEAKKDATTMVQVLRNWIHQVDTTR